MNTLYYIVERYSEAPAAYKMAKRAYGTFLCRFIAFDLKYRVEMFISIAEFWSSGGPREGVQLLLQK